MLISWDALLAGSLPVRPCRTKPARHRGLDAGALPTHTARRARGEGGGLSEVLEAGLEPEEARPDRCRRLVYEELCRSPAETIERLMEWLGESFEAAQLEFGAFPHQTGLEDPEVGRTAVVHTNSVGRWRSLLTDEDATRYGSEPMTSGRPSIRVAPIH